jgi:hypothetical protein
MLKRTVKLSSEEYVKTIAIQNAIENTTGQRPSFSQVIGMAINNLEASTPEGNQDDNYPGSKERR